MGLWLASGDPSGAGLPDLAISSDGEPGSGGDRQGAVYVLFGPLLASVPVGDADVVLRGETSLQWFGEGLAVVDHDGDGWEDLVVAAPTDKYFGPLRPGLLYVFLGPSAPGERPATDAAVIYRGIEPLEELGYLMDGCDLDADGDDVR